MTPAESYIVLLRFLSNKITTNTEVVMYCGDRIFFGAKSSSKTFPAIIIDTLGSDEIVKTNCFVGEKTFVTISFDVIKVDITKNMFKTLWNSVSEMFNNQNYVFENHRISARYTGANALSSRYIDEQETTIHTIGFSVECKISSLT